MDRSTLTDAQQLQQQYQQYQQQQQQEQHHHQQHQREQQQPSHPAQSQAPEAAAAYYAAYYQQQYATAAASQNHQYYPQDYPAAGSAAAYYPNSMAAQFEPTPVAASQPESSQIHVAEHRTEVAALSQPMESAGNMDAAERAMAGVQDQQHQPYPYQSFGQHPMPEGVRQPVGGRSQYRGAGGRRGGGQFRGGGRGRGNFGRHFHGRGRGRMGNRGGAPLVELSELEPVQAQAPVPPPPPPPVVAWCDICRVDCNRLDILETHLNGKRHKKTLRAIQRIEYLRAPVKHPSEPETVLQVAGEVKDTARVGEADSSMQIPSFVDPAPEIMRVPASKMEPAVVTPDVVQSDLVETADAVQSELVRAETVMEVVSNAQGAEGEEETPRMDHRGMKRKTTTRFGRGGKKQLRSEPRKPSVVRHREQPRHCTLCNVMCNTVSVFDTHLSGKKHVSRIQRINRPDLVYGPIPVYIPPGQPTASNGPDPLFFGLTTPELLQLEEYGYDVLRGGSWMPKESEDPEDPKAELGDPEVAVADPGCHDAVAEMESKGEAAIVAPDGSVSTPGIDFKVEEPSSNNEEPGRVDS